MSGDHFEEVFIVANIKNKMKEEAEKYHTYIIKCFEYLLKQNDSYIISTIKNNESLMPFFLSYLLKEKMFYDLDCVLTKRNQKKENGSDTEREIEEDANEINKCDKMDELIFQFYIKVINICIHDKHKKIQKEILLKFLDMPILINVIMTFFKVKKKKIKKMLEKIYKYDLFPILEIDSYVKLLYKELKNVEIGINERNDEDISNIIDEDNILFRLNEFLFCVYSFIKFFKKYYYYNMNKKQLSDVLITVKLFMYLPENEANGTSLDTQCFKSGKSFLNIFIKVYFQMIQVLYLKEHNEDRQRKILCLRFEFVKILNMFIKQVLFYGDKKNRNHILSYLINTLNETNNKINIQILQNDIQLHNWDFLDKMVLENTLDLEFFCYMNELLQMKKEKEVLYLVKKKYEKEIEQIKEVTNVKNETLIMNLFKKGNFNVNNCINMILAMTEKEMEILKKEVDEQQQKEESEENKTAEEDSDEKESGESSGSEEGYSEEETSEEESSEKGSSEEESSEEESSEEESIVEVDESGKEIIQLDEVDIINGNVDYIPDVISIFKEKEREKKLNKKKIKKKDDENTLKEEEKKKIKEKIIHLLNHSDSSYEASDNSENDIEDNLIFPIAYSKDIIEEMETMAGNHNVTKYRGRNIEEKDLCESEDEVDEDEERKYEREEKENIITGVLEETDNKKFNTQSKYNERNYYTQHGRGGKERQHHYKKFVDTIQERDRQNCDVRRDDKSGYKKPYYNKFDNNKLDNNKPNYNRLNYSKPHYNNRKRETAKELINELDSNNVPREAHTNSTFTGFRGNRNFGTYKKHGANDEGGQNVDKEKEKRQYAKKRMNAGKYHRKQYDKKMSRGMF